MRNSETGEYEGMSPYYDFDWVWSDGVVPLPDNAISMYSKFIQDISTKAKDAANKFERGEIIIKRADELLALVAGRLI